MKRNTSEGNRWFISGLSTSYILLTCYQTYFKENIHYYWKVSFSAPINLACIITILTQLPIFSCYVNSGASLNLSQYNPLQPVTVLSKLIYLTSHNTTPYKVTAMIVTLACLTTYNTITQHWSSGPYPELPWLPLTWNQWSGPLSEILHFTLSWHPSCPPHNRSVSLTVPSWPSTIIILTELH
jgi:hypothetical protein